MDDVGRWLLLLIFGVLSFCFCTAETALLSMNESKLKALMETNEKYGKIGNQLNQQPLRKKVIWLNLTYLICLCAAVYQGFMLLSHAVWSVAGPMVQQSSWTEWSHVAQGVAGLVVFMIVLLVLLCICNMLPRRIFSVHPEQTILNLYGFIRVISYLFRPLVFLIVHLSNGISRIFGYSGKGFEEEVTEEEIRSLVDEGEEKGVIEREEREMINNIFDFDDCTAADLMTHRTDVVAVDITAPISDVVYYAINRGFSRIPVYEDDIDNIKGVIYVKDLLCLVGCKSMEDFKLSDFIRNTIYVPEAKSCSDLFRLFKLNKVHMAVVVDDYGGTSGIITMEDLLEAIVGNIQDEYDNEQEEIIKLSDTTYLLDGAVQLDDAGELFQADWEEEADDYGTVGGLITELLGRIPEENETPTVEYKGVRFSVVVVEDHRIRKVKAEKMAPPPEETEEDEDSAS
ncbi:MAG: hemolysin family protein [Massiliimalia sp.]|jgi:putative hemolysin